MREHAEDEDRVVSVCADCAVHPSLKRAIEKNMRPGLCGLCGRMNAPIYDPSNLYPLVMLLRSLIRYYYSEMEYNRHFGGDEVVDLLSKAGNPICKPASCIEYLDEIEFLVTENPYPSYEEGVCLYAGSDCDGTRHMLPPISRTNPIQFDMIRERLQRENFHVVEKDFEPLVDAIAVDIQSTVRSGTVWYRARIGYDRKVIDYSSNWSGEVAYLPHHNRAIGAPPPPIASAGRMNRAGVSMLYLASDEHTAIAEIRPHPGHLVSVGSFTANVDLRIADFTPDIATYAASDSVLDVYWAIHAFESQMSMPVTPEERVRYLITQLLSESLIRRGFDGVLFRSSVGSGLNLCVFDPQKFTYMPSSPQLRRVTKLTYVDEAVPVVLQVGEDQRVIDRGG